MLAARSEGREAVYRKRSVPDWVYYAVAVLLTLVTIPMYRYMLVHVHDRPSEARAVALPERVAFASDEPSGVAVQVVSAPAPLLRPLLANELCEAGYVILKSGNAYTQGIGPDGQSARCAGRFLIVRSR